MGIIKGFKGITDRLDADEAKNGGSEDRVATKWFKLEDKQAAKIVFLQELDPNSDNYSQKNDLGVLAVEHVNPENWRRKALCTIDEGDCYGCEQHRKDYKAKWGQKKRLYINVLVDDGENEPYVAVLSQGTSGQSITPTLLEYFEDDNTITDKWFTIRRNGLKTDTSYTLRAGKEHGLNVEDYEVFKWDDVLRDVSYDQQEAHYNSGGEQVADEGTRPEAALAGQSHAVDTEW